MFLSCCVENRSLFWAPDLPFTGRSTAEGGRVGSDAEGVGSDVADSHPTRLVSLATLPIKGRENLR